VIETIVVAGSNDARIARTGDKERVLAQHDPGQADERVLAAHEHRRKLRLPKRQPKRKRSIYDDQVGILWVVNYYSY
jgi:hypothetical protein